MCTTVSIRCPLTQCTYHLVETHHTDSREDQDVHHGLHTLPTDTMYHLVEPCYSLTAVCKACWRGRSQTTRRELTSACRDSLPCPFNERGMCHQLVKQDKDIVHKTSAGKQTPVSITSATDSSMHNLLLMRWDKGIIHRTDISM